eukprot:7052768-Alexandrium_andersonii.AAC.1
MPRQHLTNITLAEEPGAVGLACDGQVDVVGDGVGEAVDRAAECGAAIGSPILHLVPIHQPLIVEAP